MSTARHVMASVLLVSGATLEVLAAVGVTAMRNVFDRLHYVGLASFGALLIGVAIVVRESFSLIGDKALATSGHIGDYIAWWSAGTSVLGAVCLLALT